VRPRFAMAYTLGEEIANSVTHGVGLVASVAGGVVLLALTVGRREALWVSSDAIYAATLVALYAASTLYHAIPHARAKNTLRVLDHAAIYLLIAGTYTPFALLNLRGAWGWSLCAIIWILAALGVTCTAVGGRRRMTRAMTVMYILMGWLIVVAIKPMLAHVPFVGVLWLVAGGLFYTGGVAFYALERRYAHALWHVFVLGGSVCHYVAVLRYAGLY